MPGFQPFFRPLPWLPLLTGISLATGLVVPSIYEWGQKPAARTRHAGMERAALAVLVVTGVVCLLVMWLRGTPDSPPPEQAKVGRRQFGLREVFAVTTFTAVVFALSRLDNPIFINGLVAVVAVALVGWSFAYGGWRLRNRLAGTLVTMFLPFAWMIAFSVPFGRTSGLAIYIPIGPGILGTALISNLIGANMHESGPIGPVIVITQLLIGAWLARRGGKLSVVYTLFTFLSASLSSLALHALYRF
jgi:hypothetical protein